MKSVWIPGLAVALTAGTLVAADEVAAVDQTLVAAFDKGDKAGNKWFPASPLTAKRPIGRAEFSITRTAPWQMAESYHNCIQASGVMTEVKGK